jgi:hypothetical protein
LRLGIRFAERAPWRLAAVLLSILGVVGIAAKTHHGRRASVAVSDPPSLGAGGVHAPVRYPRGRWRLAPWEDLDRTVLWVSHIVVFHADSSPVGVMQLRPDGWKPDGALPARSVSDALERATKIAEVAAVNPDDFERLAREYSDDRVTRSEGGSLGGVRASQLPREYLDALATLRPGEVSRAIPTSLGFVVLKRRGPPADERIAGRRIVIRYHETLTETENEAVARTREDALKVAASIAARARTGEDFAALARTFSEAESAADGGDFGVWSLRDPGYSPRQVERLGRLRVGEIAEPIETVFGFEILQRTRVDVRERFAMEKIEIPYDPEVAGGADHSRSRSLAVARGIADRIVAAPSLFDSLRREHCCVSAAAWEHGRGAARVSEAVEHLPIDAIAADPVDTGWAFVIPRRIPLAAVPDPPSLLYELPSPTAPNIEAMVEHGVGASLAEVTRAIAKEAKEAIAFQPEAAAKLDARLGELADSFATNSGPNDGAVRLASMRSTQAALRADLGPVDFEEFQRFLDARATRQAMAAGL